MKKVRILATWHETNGWGVSSPKFMAGAELPLDAETQRQVDLGNGEIFDAPDEVDAPAVEVALPPAAAPEAAPAPAPKKAKA